MKVSMIFLTVSVVLLSLIQMQASDQSENVAMVTYSVSEISNISVNSSIRITNPKPVEGYNSLKRKIVYPEFARLSRLEPCIIVRAYIDSNGEVGECQMIDGPSKIGFEDAIFNAIKSTDWTPALYNGKATPANLDLTFQFKIYD